MSIKIPEYDCSNIYKNIENFNILITKYIDRAHCCDKFGFPNPQLKPAEVNPILMDKLLKIENALEDFLETQRTLIDE